MTAPHTETELNTYFGYELSFYLKQVRLAFTTYASSYTTFIHVIALKLSYYLHLSYKIHYVTIKLQKPTKVHIF